MVSSVIGCAQNFMGVGVIALLLCHRDIFEMYHSCYYIKVELKI